MSLLKWRYIRRSIFSRPKDIVMFGSEYFLVKNKQKKTILKHELFNASVFCASMYVGGVTISYTIINTECLLMHRVRKYPHATYCADTTASRVLYYKIPVELLAYNV